MLSRHYNALVRYAWNELRDRWRNSWRPWLDDNPSVVSALILFALLALSWLLDTRSSARDFSWPQLKWMGTLALVVTAPMLAWWLTGLDIHRRERRDQRLREQKICLHCGYDMRATPDRCPECGRGADEPVDLFR